MEGDYIDISYDFRPLGNLEQERQLADKLMKSDDLYERLEGVDLYVEIHAKLKRNKLCLRIEEILNSSILPNEIIKIITTILFRGWGKP